MSPQECTKTQAGAAVIARRSDLERVPRLQVVIVSSVFSKVFLFTTLTYQNLLFCRIPINPILGFIIRTYKKVGFSRSRYVATSCWWRGRLSCSSWDAGLTRDDTFMGASLRGLKGI